MSRTKLAITSMGDLGSAGSASYKPTTQVDGVNGMYLDTGGDLHNLVFTIANTSGSPITATFVAGDNPPSQRAGLGDLEITVAATTGTVMVAGLESARFNQIDSGEGLFINFLSSGSAIANNGGSVAAFRMPGYAK